MHTQQIIATHPEVDGATDAALLRCIDECHDCVQACTACADACLAESDVQHLIQCIRLNLDCADLCLASAALGSRRTGSNEEVLRRMLEVCGEACRICAEECERHARGHEHCRICADACRRCGLACREAASTVGSLH